MARVPEAFAAESHEQSHTASEEREGMLRLLDRLTIQSRRGARLAAFLRGLVADGRHLETAVDLVGEFFTDRGNGRESRTRTTANAAAKSCGKRSRTAGCAAFSAFRV